ncbi:MAG: hypothetical protein P1V51_24870 [Deltaproteobacteria bacterium]|nr:hypothetical protein [Deltaproteobacteria bacterium]
MCKHCGGKLEVLAVITDPGVIRKILEHLRLPTSPPPKGTVDLTARRSGVVWTPGLEPGVCGGHLPHSQEDV